MNQRRKFSAEYQREAVTMLEFPGVSVSDRRGTGDWGTCPGALAREWRRRLAQAFQGNGRPWGEELAHRRRELARVSKERDCLREAAAFFARASQ